MKNTLYITVGLPGSGKTYHYKTNSDIQAFLNTSYIDGDAYMRLENNKESLFKDIEAELRNKNVYLDGLFNTKKIQEELVEKFSQNHQVVFIYFKPNIPACLHNDKLRNRDTLAQRSIQNMNIHKPYKLSEGRVSIIYHEVCYYGPIYDFLNKLETPARIASDKWCLGGNSLDCWGNEHLYCEESPTFSKAFYQLEDFLKSLHQESNINYINADLYIHLVEETVHGESDYYGGWINYGNYECSSRAVVHEFLKIHHGVTEDHDINFVKLYPHLFV